MLFPTRVLAALVIASVLVVSCGNEDDGAAEPTTTVAHEPTPTTEAPGPPTVTSLTTRGDLPGDVQEELSEVVVAVMNEVGIPGAYVGVFMPDVGEWEAAGGVADLESGEEVAFGFTWPIRSLTKSFVVTRLLQLADEEILDLDDTVDAYVDGVPGGAEITLRQLAAMSSGLPNYTESDDFLEDFIEDPFQPFTIEQLNAYVLSEDLDFEPGSEHTYSNTNTNLIGQVVEVAGGAPLDEQLQQAILEPLGLTDTAYLPDEVPEPHATGYQPSDEGYTEPPNNLSGMGPSGAMVSTPEDLRVWVEALVGGELLSEALHEQRFEAQPLVEGPVYDAYGLGIGSRVGWWGHTGQGLGFTALAMHDPESGATIVILANASETDPQPMDALFAAVEPIVAAL